ncbi:MAG: DUF4242 domain-containing protein, partial [Cyclobacteriaceae bacterium]|nr:DUF4242 domain-containing protein [Cyclobacteriaceae bacterium]
MPLFMDVHPGVKVTLQELKAMHLADLEVQEKYGVKYHRFWLNEESETVFCLMHGPNKQACMAVHEEAHGGLPCNIIEVLPGEYEFFLGQSKLHDEDRAHLTEEVPDTGFRIFIHIDTLCPSSDAYSRVRSIIGEALSTFNGREIEHLGEGIRCVFTSSLLAVEFAIAVQKALVRSAVEKSEKGGVPI